MEHQVSPPHLQGRVHEKLGRFIHTAGLAHNQSLDVRELCPLHVSSPIKLPRSIYQGFEGHGVVALLSISALDLAPMHFGQLSLELHHPIGNICGLTP